MSGTHTQTLLRSTRKATLKIKNVENKKKQKLIVQRRDRVTETKKKKATGKETTKPMCKCT